MVTHTGGGWGRVSVHTNRGCGRQLLSRILRRPTVRFPVEGVENMKQ
jgi:hypothetical protein